MTKYKAYIEYVVEIEFEDKAPFDGPDEQAHAIALAGAPTIGVIANIEISDVEEVE